MVTKKFNIIYKRNKTWTKKISKCKNFFFAILIFFTIFSKACYCQNYNKELNIKNESKKLIIPLSNWVPSGIKLKNTEDKVDLYIPLSTPLYKITKAELIINYTHSDRIIEEISQLIIKLNDEPICQQKLFQSTKGETLKCRIPIKKIKDGYNKLTIKSSMHYDKECEIPTVGFLWANIDTKNSFLILELQKEENYALCDFLKLFDEKNIIKPKLNFIIENDEYYDKLILLVNQIALKRKYQKIEIKTNNFPIKGYFNFIIGSKDFIKKFVKQKNINRISIIKEKELTYIIIPENKEINNQLIFNIKSSHKKFMRKLIKENTKTFFRELNIDRISFKGLNPKEKKIYFKLKPELYRQENQYAILSLHLTYSAGLRPDSNLNISLNDKLIASIQLGNPKGEVFEGYKIYIPMSIFNGGTNYLTLKAFMKPLKSEKCSPLISESFIIEIFGDSYIKIPKLNIWKVMPDIEEFFDTGFPYTYWIENKKQVNVIIENKYFLSEALKLIYYLTQQIKNSIPFKITKDKIFKGHFIYIGSRKGINELKNKINALKEYRYCNYTIITQQIISENPFSEGTFFILSKNDDMDQIINLITTQKISGDTLFIDNKKKTVISLKLNKHYDIGRKPLETRIHKKLFRNFKYYILISILLILLISIIIWLAIKKRIQERK